MLFSGPSKGWVGGPWGGGCGFLSGFARGFVGALGRVWGVPMVLVGAGRSFMSVLACALLVWGVLLMCKKCEGALVGPFESHFV